MFVEGLLDVGNRFLLFIKEVVFGALLGLCAFDPAHRGGHRPSTPYEAHMNAASRFLRLD